MNVQKLSSLIFFTAVILTLAISGIALFVSPGRIYSENENRYLTTFKPPSVTAFLDTSMQKNITDGANDQFAGRDVWIKFATGLQHAAGFQDIGGVYLGKNGYYFERILDSDLSDKRYTDNLNYLEQFASSYSDIKTVFLPVPSKGELLKKELPAKAVLYSSDRLYAQAENVLHQTSFFDIRPVLSASAENRQLYFKTDHHWTMEAAYSAYQFWCSRHDFASKPLMQFEPECVSEKFYGTLYSKAPEFHTQPDRLVLPDLLPQADITINGKKTDSIYDWNKLNSKDKYGVYFGGNFGRIDIKMNKKTMETENSKKQDSKQTLLVIKDSFANSFVPFLMEHYGRIIMLDFRYYNKPFSELIQEIKPDEALIFYEMSNFAQDTDFFKILK